MVELVDTRDLKSLGNSNGRAGSIPVPGKKAFVLESLFFLTEWFFYVF